MKENEEKSSEDLESHLSQDWSLEGESGKEGNIYVCTTLGRSQKQMAYLNSVIWRKFNEGTTYKATYWVWEPEGEVQDPRIMQDLGLVIKLLYKL